MLRCALLCFLHNEMRTLTLYINVETRCKRLDKRVRFCVWEFTQVRNNSIAIVWENQRSVLYYSTVGNSNTEISQNKMIWILFYLLPRNKKSRKDFFFLNQQFLLLDFLKLVILYYIIRRARSSMKCHLSGVLRATISTKIRTCFSSDNFHRHAFNQMYLFQHTLSCSGLMKDKKKIDWFRNLCIVKSLIMEYCFHLFPKTNCVQI